LAELNWADWTLISLILASSLVSVLRGFTKEALSLCIWVLAFVVARSFHSNALALLAGLIEDPMLRSVVAFVALFVGTLLVGSVFNYLVSILIKVTGLSTLDRMLGTVFGLVRGVVVCVVIVAVARYTPWSGSEWWTDSIVVQNLLVIEQWSRSVFSGAVSFDPAALSLN
jgi:membrane protein required for colicin V production